ncbi:MAG: amidohydrolase family protein [Spirochaetaceae bacterium]|nr:amidohydrolase family protein [Spirochaetaceae bacterium]HPG26233.1 amidohydrolase family protein [Myxococcota bacterium]
MARTIFTNGRVFDGSEVRSGGTTVVVEDRRIVSVGKTDAKTTKADRVVDLGGRTLMPGMVQCHFHSGFGPDAGNASPYLGLNMPPAYLGMVAAKNAQLAIDVGVTSMIGSSNGDLLDVSLKEAILLGLTRGPRVVPCTREMVTSGDAADGDNRAWFMGVQNHGLIRRVDGVESIRQAVREEVGRGCEVVKLSISNGHGSMPIPDWNYFTKEEVEVAVDTAHNLGALVRAHCPSRSGILMAARAGVDLIDHADMIDEEGIEAVLAADATVVPSCLWSERFMTFAQSWDYANGPFPINDGFPRPQWQTAERLAQIQREYEYTASMLPRLVEAGVRCVLGDDYGFAMMPHGDYASEMAVYVKHGIEPIEVMRWATRNGAQAMGRHGTELGRIEAGLLADLVVVEGDPTVDVSVLHDPANVKLVLKDGAVQKDLLAS